METGYREHRILRISFWIKLVFIIIELLLAIAFVATNSTKNYNVAAILEWIIAFVFSFYVFSFAVDLWPAVSSRNTYRTRGKLSPRGVEEQWQATNPRYTEESQRPMSNGHELGSHRHF